MRAGIDFFRISCLLRRNEEKWLMKACGQKWHVVCVYNLTHFLSLSPFGPEVWNQTWRLTRDHNNVAAQTQSDTWRCIHKWHKEEAATQTGIKPPARSVFLKNLFDALIPCTRYVCVEADVHLQSFQQASAKPRRNHFRETNMGSNQLLLSLCQRQQLNISPDTDLLLLQPSWKLKAVSEPQKY